MQIHKSAQPTWALISAFAHCDRDLKDFSFQIRHLRESSPLPDRDKNNISCTGDDEPSSINTEGGLEDITRTLTRFVEQAKLEVSVYRKFIDELQKNDKFETFSL
ncbi:MAG: hypothetical protein NT004_04360 [Bacteroidetes bacterium]|nr:hypothetical protein [Bacteroidota bacterium]